MKFFQFSHTNLLSSFIVLGTILTSPVISSAQFASSNGFLATSDVEYAKLPEQESFPFNQSEEQDESVQYAPAFLDLDWDWKALFEEPTFFEEKSSIFQLGVGLLSTVDLKNRAAELDQVDVETFIPAVHLLYERQAWKNLGVGLSVGAQIWKVPVLDYQYRYYTGGLRASYHLNVTDKLDPYVGLGGTYRRMVLTNTNRNLVKSTITGNFIMGARYYLNQFVGGYFEIGGNTTNWLKLGLSFYFS